MSSITNVGLDFFRLYLECVFDALLPSVPRKASWCADALKTFEASSQIRNALTWKQRGFEPRTALRPHIDGAANSDVVDELVWNVGGYLNTLYLTVPLNEMREGSHQIPIPEDRYTLCAGSLMLPRPTARSLMPVGAWRDFLWISGRRVFADVLLWSLSKINDPIARDAAADHFCSALKSLIMRHQSNTVTDVNLAQFRARLSEIFPEDLRTTSLLAVDAAVAAAVTVLPLDVIRRNVLRTPERRLDIIEDGLIGLLEMARSASFPLDSGLFLDYIVEATTRSGVEEFSAEELRSRATEKMLDVGLPVPADVAAALQVAGIGFRIVDRLPDSSDPSEHTDIRFALFEGRRGRSPDAIVYDCKQLLVAAISAADLEEVRLNECGPELSTEDRVQVSGVTSGTV